MLTMEQILDPAQPCLVGRSSLALVFIVLFFPLVVLVFLVLFAADGGAISFFFLFGTRVGEGATFSLHNWSFLLSAAWCNILKNVFILYFH